MTDLQPGQCATCRDNPHAAPGRWCAPTRCYCGHKACPAYVTGWVPPVRHLPTPPPRNALEARVLAIAAKPGKDSPPAALAHAERLRAEWDDRDTDTWIDRL